jgi:hypothetical protein
MPSIGHCDHFGRAQLRVSVIDETASIVAARKERHCMIVAAAWSQHDWIFSDLPEQRAKHWISGMWIWGSVGSAEVDTKHWIQTVDLGTTKPTPQLEQP